MTMAYTLKRPAGKWAAKREFIDSLIHALAKKQRRIVNRWEILEWMTPLHSESALERSIYRLAAKTEGPRLIRRGVGRYEAEG